MSTTPEKKPAKRSSKIKIDPNNRIVIKGAREHNLKNRISYYIRWPKASFFSRKKDACIICINDNVKDAAEEIVRGICDESGYNVRFILKRSSNNYL